jgi:putative sterol carrier protein
MSEELSVDEVITRLKGAFLSGKAVGVDTTIQVNLSGEKGGQWSVTIRNQQLIIDPGIIENPKLTVSADAQDCLDIYSGKLDGMKAFMSGKVHLTGNMSQAVKLATLFG